jgi:hypothetical protein
MTPEERLENLYRNFPAEVYAEDPLAVFVIKAHLLLEHYLNAILERIARYPQFLELDGNHAGFAQKVKWVRAFTESGQDERWDIATALNTLRNKVSHNFKGADRETALSKLRIKVIQFNTRDAHALDDPSFDPEMLIDVAAHICLGLLFPMLHGLNYESIDSVLARAREYKRQQGEAANHQQTRENRKDF